MATATTPRITRTDSKVGRFYDITHADGTTARYPSVTTILGVLNKPALVNWAASQERQLVSAAAADLYAESIAHPQLPRSMYLLALEQRLGKTKAHQKALTQAAEIGTACHSKIEWMLRRQLGQPVGPEPALVDAAEWAVMAFEDLAKEVQLTPHFIEQIVYSRTHGYAGTLDILATLNTRALLGVLERQGAIAPELAAWLMARETATAVVDIKSGRQIYGEAHLQNVAYQKALMEMGHGHADGGLIVRVPKLTTDPVFQVVVVPPARQLMPAFLAARQLWAWQEDNDRAYRERVKRAEVA
jgi:hypothetical protein